MKRMARSWTSKSVAIKRMTMTKTQARMIIYTVGVLIVAEVSRALYAFGWCSIHHFPATGEFRWQSAAGGAILIVCGIMGFVAVLMSAPNIWAKAFPSEHHPMEF